MRRAANQRDSLLKNVINGVVSQVFFPCLVYKVISHQEHFLFYFEIGFTLWFVPVPPVSVHKLALSVV